MIEIDQERCRNLETVLTREWIETNGIGGFSSSTITGLNIRRYHGLLTAATKPPVGRLVLLSKLEETLIIDGRRYELSANQWYRNFQYAVEQERCLDFAEDLFSPCAFTFDLTKSPQVSIIASTKRCDVGNADAYGKAEIERRNSLSGILQADQPTSTLAAASDQFIVVKA